MGRSNVNIKINRGDQLFIEWEFNADSFESVINEALDFSYKKNVVGSFSRTVWDYVNMTGTLSKEMVLIKNKDSFSMVFDTYDISFLKDGINDYEIIIIGPDKDGVPSILLEDSGTVEVFG